MNTLELITKQCRQLLCQSPQASEQRNYLDRRLSASTQEQFGFGFFPSTQDIHLLSETVGEDKLQELGLLYTKTINDSAYPRQVKFNFFENQSLTMPYRDAYGNVVALVNRCIIDDESVRRAQHIEKYKNTPFIKGNHVFGLYEAKRSILKEGFVYIVEGQFDVIKAFERGITNIVGLGTSNMSAYQCALLLRYTSKLRLLLDNDAAGEKGRLAIHEKYGKYADIEDLRLPEGYKDIDEYLKQNDVNSLEFLLSKK